MISKKKIVAIVKNLTQEENNKNSLLFYTSLKNFNIKAKKNSVIIFYGKKKLSSFIYFFFYSIIFRLKFQKNSFLLFKRYNQLIGHNFVPDWPGIYSDQSFCKNIFMWFKKVIYIFMFKKKLVLIFTRLY